MKNREIAGIFGEIADLLEIKGENPFRIRAYRRAAQNIEGLSKSVEEMPPGELLKIPGIGEDLAGKIGEYAATGKVKTHEELRRELPGGLLTLIAVPGLGPKTAKLLYDWLGVKDINELERLASEHRLAGLPGIKEKTEENILKGIGVLKRGTERRPLGRVRPIAEDILARLKRSAPVERIDLAGSIRRWKETVRDIDILATSQDPQEVMRVFVHLPQVKEVLMHGPTKSSVVTHEGIQVDLRVVEKESYGAAMAYFTGSKDHNIRIREMAVKRGLKVNEYGIFRESDDSKTGGEKEEDVYSALGLPYIPPELREDRGEIKAAQEGRLPGLVEPDDIKGDLHIHSAWSDGSNSLDELAVAALQRGYSYLAVTDHSKGLGIARGLTEERLREQLKEIRSVNRRHRGFRILSGIEVDIRSDGGLDLPDDLLGKLDLVIASIHSGFRQTREQLTKRMVSAMRNPLVSIIAHPTGRLIGEREAYDIDMEEILRVAKETGTALEINSSPLRLDLSDSHARRAKEMGIPVVISTDSHSSGQLDFIAYGVSIARRGWLEKRDILNTLSAESLLKRLKPLK